MCYNPLGVKIDLENNKLKIYNTKHLVGGAVCFILH
jgi:hypothetical protein